MRRLALALATVLALSSCSPSGEATLVEPLEPITPSQMSSLLAATDRPVVVNVWASWCAPCRSEAPLLRSAHEQWGDRVTFLGIDVRDTMDGARQFIADFRLDGFEHRFDSGGAVPAALGAGGVPLTFFFDAAGNLAYTHHGVIDERTLVLWLDEITRASS